MANDRLFLYCKKCGERKLLAKWYPSGSITYDPKTFIEVHTTLCLLWNVETYNGVYAGGLGPDSGFEVLTEEGWIKKSGRKLGEGHDPRRDQGNHPRGNS